MALPARPVYSCFCRVPPVSFSQLGRALAEHGHGVHRINFHGGDQLFWRLPGAVNYRGSDSNWPGFLEAKILDDGVTDIVLFGDCRPATVPPSRSPAGCNVPSTCSRRDTSGRTG